MSELNFIKNVISAMPIGSNIQENDKETLKELYNNGWSINDAIEYFKFLFEAPPQYIKPFSKSYYKWENVRLQNCLKIKNKYKSHI